MRVDELQPGDAVRLAGVRSVFIGSMPHPYFTAPPGVLLVIWRSDGAWVLETMPPDAAVPLAPDTPENDAARNQVLFRLPWSER